jgi:hypothetical protein
MGRLAEIVIDCDHPMALAAFWAAAIDGYAVQPPDEELLARFTAKGFTAETAPFVLIEGPGPLICCQRQDGPRLERNRIHFDLHTNDRPAEVARLAALGATTWYEHPRFTAMRDPEGNQFCVADAH